MHAGNPFWVDFGSENTPAHEVGTAECAWRSSLEFLLDEPGRVSHDGAARPLRSMRGYMRDMGRGRKW